MIPFDFEYRRPASVAEAAAAFRQLEAAGREPLWYGGGTEIITLARLGQLRPGAVIAAQRAERAAACLPASAVDDLHGSADYRLFVLRHTLLDMLAALEGGEPR